MDRVIWTRPALADLEAIADYIARNSPRQANLFVCRAFRSTDHLAAFPLSGRVVPEIGQETVREVIFGTYRIVYILSGSEVLIAMVHHAARPLTAADLPPQI